MPVIRSTDLKEIFSTRLLAFAILGILFLGFGWWCVAYFKPLVGLGWVCVITGLVGLGFATKEFFRVKEVPSVKVDCVFCGVTNEFVEFPKEDFTCIACHRLVPIEEGKVLEVSQVRCGFCNHLNYYSSKTEVLICEACNREVPIALEEGRVSTKKIAKGYVVQDDTAYYELTLMNAGPKTEEVILTLQQMLALNRNQVKDMLNELPAVLLTGITRRKAEILQAQLAIHEASAEFKQISR